ncbi:MAG: hypothetical protein WBE74_18715 [Terracidiphilus sp.]
MNEFDDAIYSLSASAKPKGSFQLLPGESINSVVARENVPNARGVYLVFDLCDLKRAIYIGKAGTVNRDGSWRGQGIRGRLKNVQKKMRRVDFFLELMGKTCKKGLAFHWFIAHEGKEGRLPSLVEMELLQAYFDEFGCLPTLNESA